MVIQCAARLRNYWLLDVYSTRAVLRLGSVLVLAVAGLQWQFENVVGVPLRVLLGAAGPLLGMCEQHMNASKTQ